MKELKGILDGLLGNNPTYKEKMKELEVYAAWPHAVGDHIARHCWAIKFMPDGVLLVGSQSSSWAHQLSYMQNQILDNLEKKLRDRRVKQIRFKISAPPSADELK